MHFLKKNSLFLFFLFFLEQLERNIFLFCITKDTWGETLGLIPVKFHRAERNVPSGENTKELFFTLQHAVISLPVHLSQCCPEVCRLWTFLNHLHLHRAVLTEAQLWWTSEKHIRFTSWNMIYLQWWCYNLLWDLHLSETLHCPPADLSGAGMSFTASPEIQHPLLAVEQDNRAPWPQTCTAAVHLQQGALLWELSSHTEHTPLW